MDDSVLIVGNVHKSPESFSNLAAKTDISLRKAAIYNRLIVLVIKHKKKEVEMRKI